MPNHITNIIGASKKVLDFLKSEESEVDFRNVIPKPKILENTVSGSRMFKNERGEDIQHNSWYAEKAENGWGTKNERPFTEEELIELNKIGYFNWYDWSNKCWGTKWNAYDVVRSEDRVQFDTAWGCPYPVIEALSEKFPYETIKVLYADEDIGSNCGAFIIKNGECEDIDVGDKTLFALRVKEYDINEWYEDMEKEKPEFLPSIEPNNFLLEF